MIENGHQSGSPILAIHSLVRMISSILGKREKKNPFYSKTTDDLNCPMITTTN
jgi:hypothetical protein